MPQWPFCQTITGLILWQDFGRVRRVARRIVVFQWDNERVPHFWLVRDYLPGFTSFCFESPSIDARADVPGARAEPVPIPWDCTDGFSHAYWRRPSAYLEAAVRRAVSPWALVGPRVEERAARRLADDLTSGKLAGAQRRLARA